MMRKNGNTIHSEDDLHVTRRQLSLSKGKGTATSNRPYALKAFHKATTEPNGQGALQLGEDDDSSSVGGDDDNSSSAEDSSEPVVNSKVHMGFLSSKKPTTWSDELEPDDVYERFKNRKSLKRKWEAKANRKARGSKQEPKDKRRRKVALQLHKDCESSEEDLGEIPDYLQDRRTQFDKRRVKLKEAGLKLPPTYEVVTFSDDERLETLQEKPDFPNTVPASPYKDQQLPYSLGLIPAPIAQWLRQYQVEGVAFLHKAFVYQQGALLGDDMGLGKTVQVIAFLTAAFGKTGDERDAKRMRKMRRAHAAWYPRVLVICPGTLIDNWKTEFDRWGFWQVDVFHGSLKETALEAATAGRVEVLITTYTTYRINQSAINSISWDAVIADECHQIKGRRAEVTQAMNNINALCRIGLTGTAIQNNYEELWTLLNWANPGKLGPLAIWKSTICQPLKVGQSHNASDHELGKGRKTAKALVANLLPQFFLRRLKTLIADQLPKKSDRVVFCPLTKIQEDAYQRLLDSELFVNIRTSQQPCDCGAEGAKRGSCCYQLLSDGTNWTDYKLAAISHIRRLASHLALLIPQGTDPKEKQDKDLALLQIALPDEWRELNRNRNAIRNYSNPSFCGKWRVLQKLLAFWHASGDKVLVFSHQVRLLQMLRQLFTTTSYSVAYLDGSLPLHERASAVANFNADPSQFVFLISTKAGGVGLNITAANKVVIVDPHWNPAYDLQAQDRAYRIGQTRNVEVFRLVSAGTIDEIIYARQIYKQQMANIGYSASAERRYFSGVQGNVQRKGEIWGLHNMFNYAPQNVLLRDIVHKTNVAEAKAGVSIAALDFSRTSPSQQHQDEFDPINPDATILRQQLAAAADSDLSQPLPDSEDAEMSQLADFLADDPKAAVLKGKKLKSKKKRRMDPVAAILAGSGIAYSHENSEVVGSSRVEAQLSRQAMERGGNGGEQGDRQLFEESQDSRSETRSRSRVGEGGEEPEWQYRPPTRVMQRQFCSMAEEFGFEDATDFALVVEGWTQAQRRACLEKWYRIRRDRLGIDKRTVGRADDEMEVIG